MVHVRSNSYDSPVKGIAMIISSFVDFLFSFYTILLSVAIISSWFPELEEFSVIRLVRACTEPYLAIFRQFIPPVGPLDLSPLVAFMVLRYVASFVRGW